MLDMIEAAAFNTPSHHVKPTSSDPIIDLSQSLGIRDNNNTTKSSSCQCEYRATRVILGLSMSTHGGPMRERHDMTDVRLSGFLGVKINSNEKSQDITENPRNEQIWHQQTRLKLSNERHHCRALEDRLRSIDEGWRNLHDRLTRERNGCDALCDRLAAEGNECRNLYGQLKLKQNECRALHDRLAAANDELLIRSNHCRDSDDQLATEHGRCRALEDKAKELESRIVGLPPWQRHVMS